MPPKHFNLLPFVITALLLGPAEKLFTQRRRKPNRNAQPYLTRADVGIVAIATRAAQPSLTGSIKQSAVALPDLLLAPSLAILQSRGSHRRGAKTEARAITHGTAMYGSLLPT
jgi:hypothetical protein